VRLPILENSGFRIEDGAMYFRFFMSQNQYPEPRWEETLK